MKVVYRLISHVSVWNTACKHQILTVKACNAYCKVTKSGDLPLDQRKEIVQDRGRTASLHAPDSVVEPDLSRAWWSAKQRHQRLVTKLKRMIEGNMVHKFIFQGVIRFASQARSCLSKACWPEMLQSHVLHEQSWPWLQQAYTPCLQIAWSPQL